MMSVWLTYVETGDKELAKERTACDKSAKYSLGSSQPWSDHSHSEEVEKEGYYHITWAEISSHTQW